MRPSGPAPFDPRRTALFLDFDGTLVPLAARPQDVAVDAGLPALLARLSEALGGALALVSGRSLASLDQFLPLGPWSMVGQHGLERRGPYGEDRRTAPASPLPQPLRQALAALTARHPGVEVEDKGLSVAVHYRAAPALGGALHRQLAAWARRYPELDLLRGKRVIELRPHGSDKASAMARLLVEPPFAGRTPIFAGDDVTDEGALARAGALGGLGVKVGPGATCAGARLRDVAQVHRWLRDSLQPMPQGGSPCTPSTSA